MNWTKKLMDMSDEIDNLLKSLGELCEYYRAHNQPADAADIQNAIDAYRKEVADIANIDMCNSCAHYMCNCMEYPCSECCHSNDMDFYEYRDNWDENGKYNENDV